MIYNKQIIIWFNKGSGRQNCLCQKTRCLLHKEESSLTHWIPKAFISKCPFHRLWLVTNHYFAFCLSPTVRSPQGDVDPSGWSRPHQSVSVLDSVSQASSPHQSPLRAHVPQKSKTERFVLLHRSKSRLLQNYSNPPTFLPAGWWWRAWCDHLHSPDFGEKFSPD